jgi:O-antigen ligase
MWVLGAMFLFTWGMLNRAVGAPVGIEDYIFVRTFGLQINALAFILACTMIFDDDRTLRLVTVFIALATLLTITLNLYEVIRPGSFVEDVRGRSVGLYVNPNDAGMAVVMGSLLGITAVPKAWRETFLAGAAAAVLSTLSRESIFGMVLVLVGATAKRTVSFGRLLLVGGGAVALLLTINVAQAIHQNKELTFASSRLSFALSDSSAGERLSIAEEMVAKFEEAPLLGHGFGTSYYWTEANESHNLYLSFLADYGIFGLLVIPCLVVSLARRTWHFYTFAATFLVWCFFTHYIFNDDFALIALAVEANRASRHDSFGLG